MTEIMKYERFVDVWMDYADYDLQGFYPVEMVSKAIREQIRKGGYVIVFWSNPGKSRSAILDEVGWATEVPDRVLIATLDKSSLPTSLKEYPTKM